MDFDHEFTLWFENPKGIVGRLTMYNHKGVLRLTQLLTKGGFTITRYQEKNVRVDMQPNPKPKQNDKISNRRPAN